MSNTKKRVYKSETRIAQAAETRNRILVSAKRLFQLEGFETVTIEKLAQVSKVSMPTIYAIFQSKIGILRALMEEALPTKQREALVEKTKREKSSKKRLMIAAKIARQMYDAERAQMDIFRGASVLAPEFKELEKEREKRRYERLAEGIKTMEREKSLAVGLTPSKAHDILWAFTGRDMYRMFVIERGWSSAKYEKWLAELLIKTLIGKTIRRK
ncbi:MAG: TetR/AcrR family transcriptional regulator [Rhabdochlamydiaceae bacterium]|nr:TetR/AcrR family transcriptional regulator [Rhabdochlamydiaceae bacterium]